MNDINKIFENWKNHGNDGYSNDELALLRAYEIIISDVSAENIFMVTGRIEQAYFELK